MVQSKSRKGASSMKELFLLDPDIIFLNHGSFGACPRPVFESYQRWQLELERQPIEFLGRRANDLLADSRSVLAQYLGTLRDNLVYVANDTTGVNIVARGLELGPGDEVLASDHEYGALDRTWRFLSQKFGFRYLNQPVSMPLRSADEFIEDFWRGVTNRTRVIFPSHITSPTAVIFPVKEICARARQSGILTVIDGAHAPGQIDLALDDLGADFYTGNLHKWLCAPKGAGFLYARPEVQHLALPLVISWVGKATPPDRLNSSIGTSGAAPGIFRLSCPSRMPSNSRQNTTGLPCGWNVTGWLPTCATELPRSPGWSRCTPILRTGTRKWEPFRCPHT